jgi:hypothetical protein
MMEGEIVMDQADLMRADLRGVFHYHRQRCAVTWCLANGSLFRFTV